MICPYCHHPILNDEPSRAIAVYAEEVFLLHTHCAQDLNQKAQRLEGGAKEGFLEKFLIRASQ